MENKSAYTIILEIEDLISRHWKKTQFVFNDYLRFAQLSIELEDLKPIELVGILTSDKDNMKLLPRLLNETNLYRIKSILEHSTPLSEEIKDVETIASCLGTVQNIKSWYYKDRSEWPQNITKNSFVLKHWYNYLVEEKIVKLFDDLQYYYNSASDKEQEPSKHEEGENESNLISDKEKAQTRLEEENDNGKHKRFPRFHKDKEIGKSKLSFLHTELLRNKLIANNTNILSVYYYFGCIDAEQPKIKWTGTTVELVCFIHELYGNKWSIATNCFIDEEGNCISSKSMSVTFSRGYKANDNNKVDEIIKLVNTFKSNKPLS